MRTVDGLSPAAVLRDAQAALRAAGGDRQAAAARLRPLISRPYRGTYAQLSDELIPSFYAQVLDVIELRPRISAAERWPRRTGR